MPNTASTFQEVDNHSDLDFFRRKIFQIAGISISQDKGELIRSRIRKRVRMLNMETIGEYKSYLESLPPENQEWTDFINVLTTNKTEWFREPAHFKLLEEEFIPKWLNAHGGKLKIWCAACSTGEEAYTLALVLKKCLPKNTHFEIFASDIDTTTLWHAKNGVYKKEQVNSIPEEYKENYFEYGTGAIEDWVKVKKELKQHITFSRINLLDFRNMPSQSFDFIFCRNVFIYFNQQTIEKIIQDFYNLSAKDSLLFVGHSESLQGANNPYQYKKSSIYSKGRLY